MRAIKVNSDESILLSGVSYSGRSDMHAASFISPLDETLREMFR